MRNLAALLAFLALIPLWGQVPGGGVKQQPQPKADQRGTQNSPVVVDVISHPKSAQETAEEVKAAKRKRLLVIIGWRGVRAANRTLRAIERQATLQAASMTQWVSVENWRANLDLYDNKLAIDFSIVNESNFPLAMRATFRFSDRFPNRAEIETRDHLFPRKPDNMNVSLVLTEDQLKDYNAFYGLRVWAFGWIYHVGVSGEESPIMSISGSVVCGTAIPTPYFDNQNISLSSQPPPPKAGLLYYLRLYWQSRKSKDRGRFVRVPLDPPKT